MIAWPEIFFESDDGAVACRDWPPYPLSLENFLVDRLG
jgi:hypothetical protein